MQGGAVNGLRGFTPRRQGCADGVDGGAARLAAGGDPADGPRASVGRLGGIGGALGGGGDTSELIGGIGPCGGWFNAGGLATGLASLLSKRQ